MDAITCIKTRRSVRKFKNEEISKDIIEDLVLAASYAPSWKKYSDYPLYCNNGLSHKTAFG